jgi:hypothetical protein
MLNQDSPLKPESTAEDSSPTATLPDPSKQTPPDIQAQCNQLRTDIRWAEIAARGLKELPWVAEPETYPGQHAEMIAQSMLAVRALEDARMRIGKVLQYAGNGRSIYDKA